MNSDNFEKIAFALIHYIKTENEEGVYPSKEDCLENTLGLYDWNFESIKTYWRHTHAKEYQLWIGWDSEVWGYCVTDKGISVDTPSIRDWIFKFRWKPVYVQLKSLLIAAQIALAQAIKAAEKGTREDRNKLKRIKVWVRDAERLIEDFEQLKENDEEED